MPLRRLIASPLVVTGVLALAVALAGCSTPTPQGGTGGQGGSGGSGTNGRPNTSQGESTPDDSGTGSGDGSDTGAGGSDQPVSGRLPADWPAEVVVAPGRIVQAQSLGGAGWLALVAADDPDTGFADSAAALKAAGYTVVSEIATDQGSIGLYENDELQVSIAVASDQSAWSMSYTITKK